MVLKTCLMMCLVVSKQWCSWIGSFERVLHLWSQY